MIALAVAACVASVSEACPFGRRKAKCQTQADCTVEIAKPVEVVEGKPVIVPVAATTAPACANGSCVNQSFQVGPQRGIFFRWGR